MKHNKNKKGKLVNNSSKFQKKEEVINKTSTKDALILLSKARNQKDGEITYHFEDGSTKRTKLNPSIFLTESGTMQDLSKVLDVIKTTMTDIQAYRFDIHV